VSSNQFVFEGLAELKEALRNLPGELTGEASHIVQGAANGATASIKANYARVSGNLDDGVGVEFSRDGFSAGAIVTSKSPHAWMYEHGTQTRRYITVRGKTHPTGAMPPAPPGRAFIPAMIKARRRMYEQFATMLERHGLVVTGSADG
jgi:hypothetical protein